jgi:sugar lactone lactonase YvrE
MLAGDVLTLAADGTVGRRHVSDVVAAVRPRRGGGAVFGVERGFVLEAADGTLTRLPPLWADAQVRMNEGGCDPDGRFYCGSMAYDQQPGAAALHRLDPDGSTSVVLDGVTVSNGLEWSPDGALAYYDDTATCRVDVFDYDRERGLHARRPFAEIPDGGRPDGLTVDEHGGVWVALADRGQVWHFSAAGVHDELIDVPVGMTTACTFGGPDLDQLFITTSRENLPPGADPLAGSLFRADVGLRGLPIRAFAG